MRFQDAIFEFVMSFGIAIRIPVLEVLQMRYWFTVIQFACSWNTDSKEIILILYTKKNSLSMSDIFW